MNYRRGANSRVVRKKKIEYESALQAEGINPVFLARKLKDLLGAQAPRWNPQKKSWEKFEDYGPQLAALREIAKILGIYAKDPDDVNEGVVIHLGKLMPKQFRAPADGEQSPGTAVGDDRERCER
jgi:hypothetical protein